MLLAGKEVPNSAMGRQRGPKPLIVLWAGKEAPNSVMGR